MDASDPDYAPGTVRLLVHNDADAANTTERLVLVPTPSSDPDDPLNWSRGRKSVQLLLITMYTLVATMSTGFLYSIIVPLADALDLTVDDLNVGTGYTYLLLGLGPLVTQPLAMSFGKRPTYLVSAVGVGAVSIWAAYSVGYSQWIANRLLIGVFAAPSFSLAEVSIADVYFVHERGFAMGAYVFLQYLGPLLAPLLSGYIYSGTNYQTVLYVAGALPLGFAVIAFFFMEETNYVRNIGTTPQVPLATPGVHNEKPSEKSEAAIDIYPQVAIEPTVSVLSVEDIRRPNGPETRYSIRKALRFARPMPGWKGIMWRGFIQPLILLRLPILWWCALQYGVYQVFFNIVNALSSLILSGEPYNFSTNAVGLTYIGPMLGTIPGALASGWISDKLGLWMAHRNGGLSEPEHKLWLVLPLIFLNPLGLLMMGLGPYYGAHWIVYVLGATILNVTGPLGTIMSLNYLFDCYHGLKTPGSQPGQSEAAPYMISFLVPSMLMAFGFGYAITPWVLNLGLKIWAATSVVMATVFSLSTFAMIKWGKRMRKDGAKYYEKVMGM